MFLSLNILELFLSEVSSPAAILSCCFVGLLLERDVVQWWSLSNSNFVVFCSSVRNYNTDLLKKDPRCLTHMFAVEEYLHDFLKEIPVRTLNPKEADWFYTPVYTTCDLTPNGLPLPFKSPRVMRSAISYISSHWPYWNRTEGADHFFVVPHDFAACFHYQVPSFSFPLSPLFPMYFYSSSYSLTLETSHTYLWVC